MVITTVMAWSLVISALNISPMDGAFISTLECSLITRQVMTIKTIKITATISAKVEKPLRSMGLFTIFSSSFSVASAALSSVAAICSEICAALSASAPCVIPPSMGTISMVTTVIRAEPTPAQERAMAVSPSLSFPPSVKAGIMDQNGMSIIV